MPQRLPFSEALWSADGQHAAGWSRSPPAQHHHIYNNPLGAIILYVLFIRGITLQWHCCFRAHGEHPRLWKMWQEHVIMTRNEISPSSQQSLAFSHLTCAKFFGCVQMWLQKRQCHLHTSIQNFTLWCEMLVKFDWLFLNHLPVPHPHLTHRLFQDYVKNVPLKQSNLIRI